MVFGIAFIAIAISAKKCNESSAGMGNHNDPFSIRNVAILWCLPWYI